MSRTLMDQARHFCAYQERCHSEVRKKLLDLSFSGEDLEQALAILISEGFLNEERFAKAFCRGKFHHKKWGRNKIIRELKQRQVSPYCIRKGLLEIDESDYQKGFEQLIDDKWNTVGSEKNIWIKKKKVLRFIMGKGYENELIYEWLSKR